MYAQVMVRPLDRRTDAIVDEFLAVIARDSASRRRSDRCRVPRLASVQVTSITATLADSAGDGSPPASRTT